MYACIMILKGLSSDFDLPETFQLHKLDQIVGELQSLEFGSCSMDMYACLHKIHTLIRQSLSVDGFASADDITQCLIHAVINAKLKFLATIAQFLEFSNLMEDYFSPDAQVLCNLKLSIAFVELKMRSTCDSAVLESKNFDQVKCDVFLEKQRDMFSFLRDWFKKYTLDAVF
eukprot:TRINITY_DN31154_c0_g1_i1.p1 TRINITY_DN31154_c0_g1~~TRINITY_DN31154_c0_g1_i1.p1  ORF type:complete len:172 (+),score=28.47 TRINITY_DN31154_c0_g1_i1:111-626(+)